MSRWADFAPKQSLFTESAQSQRARGKLARQAVPRASLGDYTAVDRDAVNLVTSRNEGRLSWLVPLRHSRMAESPFTFYRGTAGLMAFDLAHQRQTDVQLVICGDAHISNFGLYASPERRLIFDLNDFDEAAPGPWEWDVRRLLTSAVLAGRENNLDENRIEKLVLRAAFTYKNSLRRLLKSPSLERSYYSVDSTFLARTVSARGQQKLAETTTKARKRDSDRAIAHLMAPDSMGYMRFKDLPPILQHMDSADEEAVAQLTFQYMESTLPEISYLLSRFTVTDFARRVVGVGSVGTRCFVIALSGPEGRGIILQPKEATESVVSMFATPNATTPPTLRADMNQGERVTNHQRILQSYSDPFLGHLTDGQHHYYVRQFRDSKGSFDTSTMSAKSLDDYVALCALILARAHSQSPLAHWVSGYIGKSYEFDEAMTKWSFAYADQSTKDYEAFLGAIEAGEIESVSEADYK